MEKSWKRNHLLTNVLMLVVMLMWMPNVSAQSFEYPDYPDAERIAVKYQGNRPTISDFATAIIDQWKEKNFYDKVYNDWRQYQQKKPLSKNASIIVDTKNGYFRYEIINPEEKDTTVMEMCFWNCADGKRKMVCANTYLAMEDDYGWDEHIGTWFFVYDNKTRIMRTVWAEDIGALFDSDGLTVFFLPRKGKNIKVSAAGGGDRWDDELIWDGYQFK